MSLFSLEGRVAIVTGAGRGIGRGIAEGLAAQGAKIVCAARTRSQLDAVVAAIRDAGGDALAYEMDMKDLNSVRGGVDTALETYGQIDILVNNAGMNIREPFEDVTEEHYDEIMAVNLEGPLLLNTDRSQTHDLAQTGQNHPHRLIDNRLVLIANFCLYRHQRRSWTTRESSGIRTGQAQHPGKHNMPGLCGHAIDRAALGR